MVKIAENRRGVREEKVGGKLKGRRKREGLRKGDFKGAAIIYLFTDHASEPF
jgi:hypothetical protein